MTARSRRMLERPSRQAIERRLLNSGLDDIVKAKSGITAREKLVLRLGTPPRMFGFSVWLLVVALWVSFNASVTSTASRFSTFVFFDLATAVGLVVAVAVWHWARSPQNQVSARKIALAGTGGVAILAAAPYALISVFDRTIGLSALANPTGSHAGQAQSVPTHLGIIFVAAGIGGLEARFNCASRMGSVFRSASRSIVRTIRDVLWTLPIVIAALFILAFADELWKVVGQLSFSRLIALNSLLLICIVGFIRALATEKARTTVEQHPDLPPEQWDPMVPSLPTDPSEDRDLKALERAGVAQREIERTPAIQKLVVRQWRIQIATRILLAGLVISLLILVVTALTVTKPVLDEWVSPAHAPNGWTGPGGLYLTGKHVEIAVLLGAFAMVVFAGLALADDKVCERLLAPERERIRVLLTLAGTYEAAVDKDLWRGQAGDTWESLAAFVGDDPARRNEVADSYGKRWRSETRGVRWRARWNRVTGELYVFRSRPPGPVEVLAVSDDVTKVRTALLGWEGQEQGENSLRWLRGRARELQPAEVAQGAVRVPQA